MNRRSFLSAVLVACVSMFASTLIRAEEPAAAQNAAAQPLSETVQGEVKEQLDIQKPPPNIELDIKDIVESGTPRTDDVLQETPPIPSKSDFDHYAYLDSKQAMRPWLPLLPQPPLVTFYPGLSDVPAKKWEFRVSDQGGEIVKTIAGKGVPPRQLQWDGRNDRGQFITVGTLYSYQFVTFDEHGNTQTFPGEPFQLDALLYRYKGKLYVEFANQKLFSTDQAAIRPAMEGMWQRAMDVVREYSNKPLTVEVYADSVKNPLAEERRQKLINSISENTNIPSVDIRHKVDKIVDRGDISRLVLIER